MSRRDDRIRLPSSTAGITNYYSDVKTKIEFRPEYVIVLAVLIIIIELLLQMYGAALF